MSTRRSALALLMLAGCSGSLDPPSLVNKLRVLAVRSQVQGPEPDLADPYPGDSVKLDALVVGTSEDVDGGVAPMQLDYLWIACTPPPGTSDVKDCAGAAAAMTTSVLGLCSADPGAPVCLIGAGDSVTYTTAATVPAPSNLFVSMVVATQASGGAEGCLARVGRGQAPGDDCVIALKTLYVQPQGPVVPNHNPLVTSFTINGADVHTTTPMSFRLTAKLAMLPLFQPCQASEPKPDGTREVLTFSWFTTHKDFDHFHSGYAPAGNTDCSQTSEKQDNSFTDQTGNPGPVHFWLVVRDDRGGVGWTDGMIEVSE